MSQKYLVTLGGSHWLASDPETVGRIAKLLESLTPLRHEWITGESTDRLVAPIAFSLAHEMKFESLRPGQCVTVKELEERLAAAQIERTSRAGKNQTPFVQ